MTVVTKSNSRQILKKYLKDHGIKQSFVAGKLGVSDSTFNAYLQGYVKFTMDFAYRVSNVLGIDPGIFLDESYKK